MRSLRQKLDRLEERLRPTPTGLCCECGHLRGPSRSGRLSYSLVLPGEDGWSVVVCKMCGWCFRARLRSEGARRIAEDVEETTPPF